MTAKNPRMYSSEEDDKTSIALIRQDLAYLRKGQDSMQETYSTTMKDIRENYVARAEFEPVKRIVYGIVTICLTAIIGALLSLVVIK